MSRDPQTEKWLTEHGEFAQRLARHILQGAYGAEDVAQDAAVIALDRGGPAKNGWYAGVVRNLANGVLRSRARRRWFERDSARIHLDRAESDGALEAIQRVTAAARSLHEPYRSAIVRRFLKNESFEEIAHAEGLTAAAIRQRVSRGLSMLRTELSAELDDGKGSLQVALAPLLASKQGSPKIAAAALAIVAAGGVAIYFGLRSPGPLVPSPALPQESLIVRVDEHQTNDDGVRIGSVVDAQEQARQSAAGPPSMRLATARIYPVDQHSGLPVESARALVLLQNGDLQKIDADSDGQLVIPIGAKALAARGPKHAWSWAECPDTSRDVRLELEAARSVRIDATVDGREANAAERLKVVHVERRAQRHLDAFAGAPFKLLGGMDDDQDYPIEQGEDGAIRALYGAATGEFAINVSDEFLIRDVVGAESHNKESAVVALGTQEVLVELHTNLGISGRILWQSERTPVHEGFVEVAVLYGDGTKSYRTRADIEEGGRFKAFLFPYAAAFQRPAPHGIQLEVHPAQGEITSALFSGAQLGAEGDLPDVLVRAVADVWIRCTDEAGRGIQGAIGAGDLHRDYGTYVRHVVAGADGVLHLRGVAAGVQSILLTAPGREILDVAIQDGRGAVDAPLTVVLPRANQVRFIAAGTEHDPADFSLKVTTPPPLLALEARAGFQLNRARFADVLGIGAGAPPKATRRVSPRQDNDSHELWDLVPGRAVTAELRDDGGRLMDRVSFVTPPRGQLLEVTLRADRPRERMDGRVVDEDSRPVEQAYVRLVWPGGTRQSLGRTGADGSFGTSYPVDATLPEKIEVRHQDFVRLDLPCPAVDAQGELPPIRLQRARTVTVTVVDPSGSPLAIDSLRATAADGREFTSSSLEARGVLGGLPSSKITIDAWVGGRRYSGSVEVGQAALNLTAPQHGRLRVQMADLVGPTYGSASKRSIVVRNIDEKDLSIKINAFQPVDRLLLPGRYVVEGRSDKIEIFAGKTTTWRP